MSGQAFIVGLNLDKVRVVPHSLLGKVLYIKFMLFGQVFRALAFPITQA